MELPELFMEFISSMTGKSPVHDRRRVRGRDDEGAVQRAARDLRPQRRVPVSFALTGYDGWLSSAGTIGPKMRIDHDFSLLVPEIFSRMSPAERDARSLIENGYLERMADFDHNGEKVLASRLGYRMNEAFATHLFGRIFLHPDVGVHAADAQAGAAGHGHLRRVDGDHRQDPPAGRAGLLRRRHRRGGHPAAAGLLEIMETGTTAEGLTLDDAAFRDQFSRESVLGSDWYAARLDAKRDEELAHQERSAHDLRHFLGQDPNRETATRLGLAERLAEIDASIEALGAPEYRASLVGTIGRQPLAQ
jgi:hypothetical protein